MSVYEDEGSSRWSQRCRIRCLHLRGETTLPKCKPYVKDMRYSILVKIGTYLGLVGGLAGVMLALIPQFQLVGSCLEIFGSAAEIA